MNLFGDDAVTEFDLMDRWPHQSYAVAEVFRLIDAGVRRICVQSPTGGGKSVMQFDTALRAMRERGWGVNMFANRKMLIEQMMRNLKKYGIDHGVRSAAHDHGNSWEPFQISSIQTEYSRVIKRKNLDPHPCQLIIVDEAHINENDAATEVYEKYLSRGAVKIGFTATPLGIDSGYDELVQAGTNSELRACGALVAAEHFGCTEPDLKNIKKIQIGEDLSDPQNVKAIMVPGIHGRVIQWYRRLNPHGLASIGFGPGVPESFGFAEAFWDAGISAAHIDGERIWVNGEWLPSTGDARDKLLDMSRTGKVRIIWSRFVLREAVDMPWLQHGIFATVFGSLQSYLQSGGRLLRSCPVAGKEKVTVQDHGGNWWRHGSLNADRHWSLADTNRVLGQERLDAMAGNDRKPDEPAAPEPFLCKECQTVLILRNIMVNFIAQCPRCGHQMDFRRRSRPVIQANGELVEYPGNIVQRRRTEVRHDTFEKWRGYFFRARNSNMTFGQAVGLFYHDHGYMPPRSLPLMPLRTKDWYMPVKKIPFNQLRPETKDA